MGVRKFYSSKPVDFVDRASCHQRLQYPDPAAMPLAQILKNISRKERNLDLVHYNLLLWSGQYQCQARGPHPLAAPGPGPALGGPELMKLRNMKLRNIKLHNIKLRNIKLRNIKLSSSSGHRQFLLLDVVSRRELCYVVFSLSLASLAVLISAFNRGCV